MKDAWAGTPIAEFVRLRTKMYLILTAAGTETRKAKGVKRGDLVQHLNVDAAGASTDANARIFSATRL